MIPQHYDCFREIWTVDSEFHQPTGERPVPIVMVARELRTGQVFRQWGEALTCRNKQPFDVSADALFVAYYASAKLSCFRALDWPMPERILDLCVEFKNATSGLVVPCGRSLLGALAYHGIPSIDARDKESMRDLAIRGGPFTAEEEFALVDYCQADVDALAKLFAVMSPKIDLPRALLRGRYMAAVAQMEWTGTPIDAATLERLLENWVAVKAKLVAAVDQDYGVYAPTGRTLDPSTRLGEAILKEAAEWNIDPYKLADAVDMLWSGERDAEAEQAEALRDARKRTGLTAKRIARWEDSGRDHSTFPGLDETARSVATDNPELGIDPADYGASAWQLMREPSRRSIPKHDPSLLRRAAGLVARSGNDESFVSMSFSSERFAAWLVRNSIPWPRLESGELNLSDDVFRQMARSYPAVAPLRELRFSLSQMRLSDLAVGSDGRNRCMLSAFASRTGRNQPSNAKFIFGPSVWLRGLIQPPAGRAIAYCDWAQQEFGIAGALSGDANMKGAYTSGDPYLAFAKQAGAVPADATKHSHKAERERFKICALAVQYGMHEKSLAVRLGQPEAYARELLRLHRETYPTFWRWSQAAVDHAMLCCSIYTVFGWTVQVSEDANPRSLANFPMQGNGAEMLRLACCLATERGISVCAPVHDALLIEADSDEIEQAVADTQAAMREASEVVLAGFALQTDATIVRHPDRYSDPRGERMWQTVFGIVDTLTPADRVPF